MTVLLKSAKIICPNNTAFHNKTKDILIENGIIAQIADRIEKPNVKTIQLDNLHVSAGWFDSSVSFGEPGHEDRETIKNGLQTAAKSGFTDVIVNPNTTPVIDSNADISFLKSAANGNKTRLHPSGALTMKSEGIDLAELFDMKNAGAVAFNDYQKPIKNANLLKIALLYTQSFDGLVYSFPQDNSIATNGVMNEGDIAAQIGLKGIPAMAEELQVVRDLSILEYTGGKLHIPTISTAGAVKLIKEAKKKGLDVSCSVAVHNLFFTDEKLKEFDTSYKVLPPLRTKIDVKALIKGLDDETIDFVTSDHNPIDIEHKKVEFEYALYGSIGLESFFGALNRLVGTEKAIYLLTKGRKRFGIQEPELKEGSTASLTLFNPEMSYIFNKEHIYSSSANSVFLTASLKGIVYGIFSNNQLLLNQ
ncbi:dihydroorotase [Leptobacterium sp. I13]|uniref:dihydroorotase n=1 Tax=Leptobacterium meishanense TaxID=3128904 RepID=UPI0030EC102A